MSIICEYCKCPKKPPKWLDPNKARNDLHRWVITYGGQTKLATKLGVSKQAVSLWCLGRQMPGLKYQKKIIRLSKGEIGSWTFDEVFHGS